jgi:hypothetical protein
MNKKLQSMYKSGGLLKALLKDPAQRKMAEGMLKKMAMGGKMDYGHGGAMKYRMGGEMKPLTTKLGAPAGLEPGAKNTYAGGGMMMYRRGGKAMYENGGQNGPPTKADELYAAFEEVGTTPDIGMAGDAYSINTGTKKPSTAAQIARYVRSGKENYTTGAGKTSRGAQGQIYSSVVPTIDNFLQAVTEQYNLDPSTLGGSDMTPEQVLQQAFGMAAGQGLAEGSPGNMEFDRLMNRAVELSNDEYARRIQRAENAKRKDHRSIKRNPGESDKDFFERRERARFKPEMKEFNILQDLGDRLIENYYGGDSGEFTDEAYDQARYQNEETMRQRVIQLLNEYAGSDAYNQFGTMPKYHSGYVDQMRGPN